MKRMFFAVPLLIALLFTTTLATPGDQERPRFCRGDVTGTDWAEIPARGFGPLPEADTTWFGQYELVGDEYYALAFDNKIEGSWTFDLGTGPGGGGNLIPNGEGWTFQDLSVNSETYFRIFF